MKIAEKYAVRAKRQLRKHHYMELQSLAVRDPEAEGKGGLEEQRILSPPSQGKEKHIQGDC